MLYLCSFFAPDDIPKEIIIAAPQYLSNEFSVSLEDPFILDDAFIALRRYSLIETTADALSIHGLLQAVIFDSLGDDLKLKFAEAAVRLIDSAFPDDPNFYNTWASCSRLLSHAVKVAQHAQQFNVALEYVANLIGGVGQYLFLREELSESNCR